MLDAGDHFRFMVRNVDDSRCGLVADLLHEGQDHFSVRAVQALAGFV